MDNLTEKGWCQHAFVATEIVTKVLTVKGRWCYWQRLKMALSRINYLTNQMLPLTHIFSSISGEYPEVAFNYAFVAKWYKTIFFFYDFSWEIYPCFPSHICILGILTIVIIDFLWLYQGAILWNKLMFKY